MCREMNLVFVLLCAFIVGYLNGNDSVTYKGILTPECVRQYERVFVTKLVPPRRYLYHHEILAGHMPQDFNPMLGVSFGWRIVGGRSISIEEAPYQALYGRYCGGTIIAPEWVLTSAHCKAKENYVYVGSTKRSEAQMYKVCAHFIHPLWNKTRLHSHDYDYQLILLEKPIPITAKSRPVAIGSTSDIVPGAKVAISGWGHLQYKKSQMQDILRRVFVPIISTEECKSLPEGNYSSITPRMFCAGYLTGSKDSCQGDSGGPVVSNGKLIGLVSYGIGCALPNKPGVYANVPVARDWIRSITALPL